LRSAAHYFELSANQRNVDGQCDYGICHQDGEGIWIDLRSAAHYFKLSADQENAAGQGGYGICLQNG
jgi:TPR repeat protein